MEIASDVPQGSQSARGASGFVDSSPQREVSVMVGADGLIGHLVCEETHEEGVMNLSSEGCSILQRLQVIFGHGCHKRLVTE
jgi:hypothetical protein